MIRRALLTGLAAGVAAPALGHTLYPQWVAYRRKHLLVGCHRKDMTTWHLAEALAAEINAALPEAKARVARAPHPERLASLLGTDQMEIAVLGPEAVDLAAGEGRFAPYGLVPLRLLAGLGDHALYAHGGFPDRHAWMVRAALHESALLDEAGETVLPWHPGAVAQRSGAPMPVD